MVIGKDARIISENFTFLRIVDIELKRQHPLLTGFCEQQEQQRHQIHIQRLAVFGATYHFGQGPQRGFDGLSVVADDKRADAGAADNQEFRRLVQRAKVAAHQ